VSRRLRAWMIMTIGVDAMVLAFSGGWADPWMWSYCALWTAALSYGLLRMDDGLAEERFNAPEKGADAIALVFVRISGIAHLAIGALDSGRWHLLAVPSVVRGTALAGMALSFILVFRSMHENRFFSSVVRVQRERGHRVVDTGPYSVIRHPGYLGMIAGMPLSGLALGSWVGFGIALVYSGMIMRRVLFEDAFLRQNLDGYDAYSRRTTARLIPKAW
jgi:protein-S-isoprenylcysteine O-methyltransferase Ste14